MGKFHTFLFVLALTFVMGGGCNPQATTDAPPSDPMEVVASPPPSLTGDPTPTPSDPPTGVDPSAGPPVGFNALLGLIPIEAPAASPSPCPDGAFTATTSVTGMWSSDPPDQPLLTTSTILQGSIIVTGPASCSGPTVVIEAVDSSMVTGIVQLVSGSTGEIFVDVDNAGAAAGFDSTANLGSGCIVSVGGAGASDGDEIEVADGDDVSVTCASRMLLTTSGTGAVTGGFIARGSLNGSSNVRIISQVVGSVISVASNIDDGPPITSAIEGSPAAGGAVNEASGVATKTWPTTP